jgi:hypothetical protein
MNSLEIHRKFPPVNFFVIGAAKCGTTSLYRTLSLHPKVFAPSIKEPRFFSETEVIFDDKINWYNDIYKNARFDQLCGDFSPSYSVGSSKNVAAARIATIYPNAKIIYMIRNPIACAISNWRMAAELAGNSLPFGTALTGDWNGVLLQRAMFYKQLGFYLRYFPQENILVVPLELVKNNSLVWLQRIQLHIGIQPDEILELQFNKVNASSRKPDRPEPPIIPKDTRKMFLDLILDDAFAMLDWLSIPRTTWNLNINSPEWTPARPTSNSVSKATTAFAKIIRFLLKGGSKSRKTFQSM